jgi:hypothetical protein
MDGLAAKASTTYWEKIPARQRRFWSVGRRLVALFWSQRVSRVGAKDSREMAVTKTLQKQQCAMRCLYMDVMRQDTGLVHSSDHVRPPFYF